MGGLGEVRGEQTFSSLFVGVLVDDSVLSRAFSRRNSPPEERRNKTSAYNDEKNSTFRSNLTFGQKFPVANKKKVTKLKRRRDMQDSLSCWPYTSPCGLSCSCLSMLLPELVWSWAVCTATCIGIGMAGVPQALEVEMV